MLDAAGFGKGARVVDPDPACYCSVVRCIYCLESSDAATTRAHAVPEAIARNTRVLPLGALCDRCNSYIGHELDSTLVAHPVISLQLQTLGMPGKGGKARKRLGNVVRKGSKGDLWIPISEPKFFTDSDGQTAAEVEPLIDSRFDMFRFRRAVHCVAFNCLALHDGVELALETRFDSVRRYVRSPRKREGWPYAQHWEPTAKMTPTVKIGFLRGVKPGVLIGVRFLSTTFVVDLLNTGTLEKWTATSAVRLTYFGPEQHRAGKKRRSRR